MTRRLLIGAILTLPLLIVEMSHMIPSAGAGAPAHRFLPWLELLLATPVVLFCGAPLFQRGWESIRTGHTNMFTLIAAGTGVAYGTSVVGVLAPGVLPAAFRDAGGTAPLYFETAAVITVLVLLGQVLELRARARTGEALRQIAALLPRTALRRSDDGREIEVALDAVRPGDLLLVRPGARVPVDGIVEEGTSGVDESLLTGESIPVSRGVGERVVGGSLNGRGALLVRAGKVGADSVVGEILRLVSEAQRSRAPIQRRADAVAEIFVPAVLVTSAITFAFWAFLGPEPRLAHALVAAVGVLIIACPCALGLATPMSIMVAAGRGATAGILFRDASALEALERVKVLVIDKTGTLTMGQPAVTDILPVTAAAGAAPMPESQILSLAAAIERRSEHPLAAAIVGAAGARALAVPDPEGFDSIPGGGASGIVGGRVVAVGNEVFLSEIGVSAAADEITAMTVRLRQEGRTVVLVAVDGQVRGVLGIADPIRPSTSEALRQLGADGLSIVMATGDNRRTAAAIGGRLAIDRIEAELTPAGKADLVRRLREAGNVVAMAGDGVNDAIALAAADVGIAVGTGTDAAIGSAGVTLVRGDLAALVRARALSRATMRNVRQNLFFAFAYNALCIPLAAGLFYPLFGWLLSPMIASAAMSLSSVSVIANALRLRRARL
jgi:Cu+-exporting ATPase